MDIKHLPDLKKYLDGIDFLYDFQFIKAKILTGGVSANTVFVEGASPIVVKQALGKLKTDAEWISDPARIAIEHRGLKWLSENLPSGSVPKPIYFDGENDLLIMEGISPPVANLKSLLLAGNVQQHLISDFGSLLGMIHKQGSEDLDAATTFANREFFINLRLDPYYTYTGSQVPEAMQFLRDLFELTLDQQITIVHGDYSPKNILVKDGKLILLDHEVMHYGDPAFDVGFSLTHLLSKANHLRNIQYVDLALLVWDNYRKAFSFNQHDYESRCIHHLLGCMLARIHGKSPLEYLSETHREWQSQITLKLIHDVPETLSQLFNLYKRLLNERES